MTNKIKKIVFANHGKSGGVGGEGGSKDNSR